MFIAKDYKTLAISITDQVATVMINREDKLNALNREVLSELKDFLEHLNNEDSTFSVRGVILTGSGEKAFIAGADIKEMADMPSAEAKEFGDLGQGVSLLLEKLSVPVIACVNGFALGGGCEMAISCDFIYATKSAVFGQPEVKLGLIPGFGGTQRLAKLVGRNRAKEIIYTGKNVDAAEAYRIGLVNELFETKDELLAAATKTLQKMRGSVSPVGVKLSKDVMNKGNDLTVEQGLSLELDLFESVFNSEDMREGTKAFMEKRKPEFKGR